MSGRRLDPKREADIREYATYVERHFPNEVVYTGHIDQLFAEIVALRDERDAAEAARVGALAEAARLREALEFYGDPARWAIFGATRAPIETDDAGAVARAALSARVSPAGVTLTPEQAGQVRE